MLFVDTGIIGMLEDLNRAAHRHQGDALLLLNTLTAVSSIVEGIPGDDARRAEQMIDACVMATERSLSSIQESRGELHEVKMEIAHLMGGHCGLIGREKA